MAVKIASTLELCLELLLLHYTCMKNGQFNQAFHFFFCTDKLPFQWKFENKTYFDNALKAVMYKDHHSISEQLEYEMGYQKMYLSAHARAGFALESASRIVTNMQWFPKLLQASHGYVCEPLCLTVCQDWCLKLSIKSGGEGGGWKSVYVLISLQWEIQ